VLGLTTSQADIEDQVGIPHGVLTSFYDEIAADGYLARADGHLELTADGRSVVTALGDAWTQWLVEQLADWAVQTEHTEPAELDEQVRAAVGRIARRVMLEQQRELQPA
jgi:predicted DNA-binding transcriptional regulator YafY